MATFKFGRRINIHWNGYDIVGPADTVFSIPDQLYEEFNADIAPVEPTLTWIDTNEFQTLKDAVVTSTIVGSSYITTAATTAGTQISIVSGTATSGYVLTANGSGGVSFQAAPGGAGALSTVIGTSPASVVTSSGTATVSIDQAAITGATAAANAQTVRTYVKNTTGSTIPLGSAVYVSGATGDNALISLATASTEAGSSKTLGITAESIANDAFGYVVESGYLTGIDTTGISAGTAVWLGTTPGSLVYTPPAEPNHTVYLGRVIREQQNNGSILVKVQNGYELDELHDVSAGTPTDLDILQYKNSSGLWTKASIANAGIAASTHTHDYQATGTYVNAVVGTSPASVSTASGTATVSIVAGSINSTHLSASSVGASQIIDASIGSTELADNAVVAAKISAAAVDTSKINSGVAAASTVLTANGTGGASFSALSISSVVLSTFSASGTWVKPANCKFIKVEIIGAGQGGKAGERSAASGNKIGGLGGHGGAWAYLDIDAASLASSITVTIGAGGLGQTATTQTMPVASPTSFGSYQIRTAPFTSRSDYGLATWPQFTAAGSSGEIGTAGGTVYPASPGDSSTAGYKGDFGGGGGGGGANTVWNGVTSTDRYTVQPGAGGARIGLVYSAFDTTITTTWPTGGGGIAGTSNTTGTPTTGGNATADSGAGGGGGGCGSVNTASAGAGGNGAQPGGGGGGGGARSASTGVYYPGGNGGAGRIQVWAFCG